MESTPKWLLLGVAEISDGQYWAFHQMPPTLPRIEEKGRGQAPDTHVLEAGVSVCLEVTR